MATLPSAHMPRSRATKARKTRKKPQLESFLLAFPLIDHRQLGEPQFRVELRCFKAAGYSDAARMVGQLDVGSLLEFITDPTGVSGPKVASLEGAALLRSRQVEIGTLTVWSLSSLSP